MNGDGGFILVPLLILLAATVSIIVAIQLSGRLEVQVSHNRAASTEARLLADGFTRLAALTLSTHARAAPDSLPFLLNGTLLECVHGAHRIVISVQDAAGLVDINVASVRLLEHLLRSIDVSVERAMKLAAAIVDFRDPDNIPILNGAERSEYAAAKLHHGPKNAPFETVGELEWVLGMTSDVLRRLLPLVTISNGSHGVDPQALPKGHSLFLKGSLPSELVSRSSRSSFIVTVNAIGVGRASRVGGIVFSNRTQLGFQWNEWRSGMLRTALPHSAAPTCLSIFLRRN